MCKATAYLLPCNMDWGDGSYGGNRKLNRLTCRQVKTMSCPLSVCAAMEMTSNEYLHRLRECMPVLLCTYWTLAAGAAAFALLPVDLAPGVRCCSACDHLVLRKQTKQSNRTADAMQKGSTALSSERQAM